jgi:hypothetical protein
MLALFIYTSTIAKRFLRLALVSFALFTPMLIAAGANADQVQISNLSDVTIPLWVTGDPDIIQDVFVCVYRENNSGTSRSYSIQATGDGPGFALKDGTQTLPYSITWNDGGESNPGGGTTATMVNNVALSNRSNARIDQDLPANSADCNGGSSPTARLRFTVSATDMDAAPDGAYSGTLTLLLSLI